MFLLGNAYAEGLRDEGQVLQGSYVAAFDGDRIVAVAAHYWNGHLVLQAPKGVVAVGRAAVSASGRALRGVSAPVEQVEALLNALELSPEAFQVDDTEKLYRLPLTDLLVPIASAQVRRAELGDLELLTRWRVAYALETLNEMDTPELWASTEASVRRYLAERSMWLMEAGGKPVSCSGFNTRTQDAVQIGGVYTPPEFRGRGYARATVAASLVEAKNEGVTQAVLFTPLTNGAAQRAYEAIGFRSKGRYRVTLLKEPVALN